jgi:hypothetical protein
LQRPSRDTASSGCRSFGSANWSESSAAPICCTVWSRQAAPAVLARDETIRTSVQAALLKAGVRRVRISVVLSGGIVHLWGAIESNAERQAARVAAENVSGVNAVCDAINVLPPNVRAVMWVE